MILAAILMTMRRKMTKRRIGIERPLRKHNWRLSNKTSPKPTKQSVAANMDVIVH